MNSRFEDHFKTFGDSITAAADQLSMQDRSTRDAFLHFLNCHIDLCQTLSKSLAKRVHDRSDECNATNVQSCTQPLAPTRSSSGLSSPANSSPQVSPLAMHDCINPARLNLTHISEQLPSPSVTPARRQEAKDSFERRMPDHERSAGAARLRLGVERKQRSTTRLESHPKRIKTRTSSPSTSNNRIHVDLEIPQTVVQPPRIVASLSRSCPITHVDHLLRLFYGIGSPDALLELRHVLILSRKASQHRHRGKDTFHTLQALDQLSATDCATAIVRRICLARLVDLRDSLNLSFLQTETGRSTRKKQSDRYGRASSLALDELMRQGYPDLQPQQSDYERRRIQLKSRLGRGRNWHKLQETFSSGILTVIPREGPFALPDSQVESLSVENFNAFITILLHHRGQFLLEMSSRFTNDIIDAISSSNLNIRFVLEDVDEHIFEQDSYDSDRLLSVADRTM